MPGQLVLDGARPDVPHLHDMILGYSDQPVAIGLEVHCSDVTFCVCIVIAVVCIVFRKHGPALVRYRVEDLSEMVRPRRQILPIPSVAHAVRDLVVRQRFLQRYFDVL